MRKPQPQTATYFEGLLEVRQHSRRRNGRLPPFCSVHATTITTTTTTTTTTITTTTTAPTITAATFTTMMMMMIMTTTRIAARIQQDSPHPRTRL